MTFEELLNDSFFNLPKTQKGNADYKKCIEEILNEYLTKITDVDFVNIPKVTLKSNAIKNRQKNFVAGILQCLNIYYDGRPSNSYQVLKQTLEDRKANKLLMQSKYPIDKNFYRIRFNNSNFLLEAKELFHIPFNLRTKITTQRFSIPGFPSLYLGTSLYICWEELNRPDLNQFVASRLRSLKEITFLDLGPPDFNIIDRASYRFIIMWPLIAACSIKVKHSNDPFKPEYIIPQLLLQWIREEKQLDGIRYKSTHLKPEVYNAKGELYNLVLPVKSNLSEGICDNLKEAFEISEPVSNQLIDLAIGGQTFTFNKEEEKPIDDRIPEKIEFIKGRSYPYSYSALGNMERFLDTLPMQKLS